MPVESVVDMGTRGTGNTRAERRRLARHEKEGRARPRGRPNLRLLSVAVVLVTTVVVMANWEKTPPDGPVLQGFEILATHPHDPDAFTQGLAWHAGHLFEGTGRIGTSWLRKVVLETGEVTQEHVLAGRLFGEGITVFGDRIIQLTYKAGEGIVYDLASFEEKRRFQYPGEGWGLTHDGKRLIMSNGSSELWYLDTETFERRGELAVTSHGKPVKLLNELEFVRGEIWANIWNSDRIARIDPRTGEVRAYVDLSDLKRAGGISGDVEVLNGIAWDAAEDRIFVTGKLWPRLFQIRVIE